VLPQDRGGLLVACLVFLNVVSEAPKEVRIAVLGSPQSVKRPRLAASWSGQHLLDDYAAPGFTTAEVRFKGR